MEIRHLRYFVAVAEAGNFARAAERLGIAPPTLTVQIQALERSAGAAFFERHRRGAALTPAGVLFLAEAQAALRQFDQALRTGQRAGRGELGHIVIGYVGSAVLSGALQRWLRQFRERWPDVHLELRETAMALMPAWVLEGRLDVAVLRLPMAPDARLQVQVLWRDRYCLALPDHHPLAGERGAVRSSRLADASFIQAEQVEGMLEVGRRGGFTPRVVSAPGSLMSVMAQVSLGGGVAVVPDVLRAAMAMPSVVLKPLAGRPVPSEVAAVSRRDGVSGALQHLLREADQISAKVMRLRPPALER